MNKPPLNQLMENMDSKYDLVIVAAKRARTMISDNPDMLATSSMNPVSMALNEIAEGKTFWPPKNTAE